MQKLVGSQDTAFKMVAQWMLVSSSSFNDDSAPTD